MADALAIILGAIGGLFFIGCICCCGDPAGGCICCDPEYGTPVRRSNTEVATSNETNVHVTQGAGNNNDAEEFERTENL